MDLSKVYTVKGIQGIIKKCFKQETKTFFDNLEDIFERYWLLNNPNWVNERVIIGRTCKLWNDKLR